MSKYRFVVILLFCCAAIPLTAQHLYTDTFRLDAQKATVEMDALLLDLVNEQSEALHAADTIDTLTLAERMRLDSIERELREIDSLRNANEGLVMQTIAQVPTIEVEKSWVKDEVEDRNDLLQAIREMRSPWRREATIMAQITQNYVTDNWYQGGSSSFAGLGIAKGQVSYIRERFTWENTGEWRIGGSTVSPVSYKVIHIMDTVRVNPTDFGLDEHQRTQHNIGSSMRVEYVWKPVREVNIESKFYLYTNYQNVEVDLEVNCDFIINRFLSARLMLHPRYDSTVIKEGDTKAKMQFRELLSIGFSHRFR